MPVRTPTATGRFHSVFSCKPSVLGRLGRLRYGLSKG